MSGEKFKGYCVSCQTDDVECKKYPGYLLSDEHRDLCDICASTFIGNYTYRGSAPSMRDLAVAFAQVAHLLRAEMRKAASPRGRREGGRVKRGALFAWLFYACAFIWSANAALRMVRKQPDVEMAMAISLLCWIAARQRPAGREGGSNG